MRGASNGGSDPVGCATRANRSVIKTSLIPQAEWQIAEERTLLIRPLHHTSRQPHYSCPCLERHWLRFCHGKREDLINAGDEQRRDRCLALQYRARHLGNKTLTQGDW